MDLPGRARCIEGSLNFWITPLDDLPSDSAHRMSPMAHRSEARHRLRAGSAHSLALAASFVLEAEDVHWDAFFGQAEGRINHAGMVGEHDHLRRLGELGEDAQGRFRSFVVEVHEEVVGDEGHRLHGLEHVLHARDSQGQVELVAGA